MLTTHPYNLPPPKKKIKRVLFESQAASATAAAMATGCACPPAASSARWAISRLTRCLTDAGRILTNPLRGREKSPRMILLCTKVSRLENNEHILGRNTEGIIDNVSVEGILVCVQQYEIIFASTSTCIPNVSPTVTCRIWQQVNIFFYLCSPKSHSHCLSGHLQSVQWTTSSVLRPASSTRDTTSEIRGDSCHSDFDLSRRCSGGRDGARNSVLKKKKKKKARSLSVVLKERLHELPKLLLRTTGSEPAPRCLLLHKKHDTKCLTLKAFSSLGFTSLCCNKAPFRVV